MSWSKYFLLFHVVGMQHSHMHSVADQIGFTIYTISCIVKETLHLNNKEIFILITFKI
jgi:hypothetical protein